MKPVRPYPWGALAPTTLATEASARDLRRWIARHVDVAKLASALGELTAGARVAVRVRGIEAATPRDERRAGAVVVAFSVDGAPDERVTIEVESALAATVLARALRRPPPRVIDPRATVDPALGGAFAAVLLAALRRATAPERPLRLAGTAGAASTPPRDALTLALTAMVDEEAYLVRVTVSAAAAAAAAIADGARLDRHGLATLGDVPLALPIVASVAAARSSDVAALEPGAAWVPPRGAGLAPALAALRGRGDGATVLLAAPSSDRALTATLGVDGRVVVVGSVESLAMDESALIENLGEVPVVVRVEIGSCSLRAREWAALGAGDVVALGRRVGEPVVLRVADREVARGELVDIDGEVGVRIVERLP